MFDKIEYAKKWRLENQDKINEYKRKNPNYNIEYRKKNINNIKKLFKQKIKCRICSKEIGQYGFNNHLKSTYHLRRLNNEYVQN